MDHPDNFLDEKEATKMAEKCGVRGFFRLNIEEDGKVIGDSGWQENLVTNLGFQLYLADNIGKTSGSKQIAYCALGTGGTPSAADTTLGGEIMASTQRGALTYLNVSSKTAQFTATFSSSASFITASSNISNIGLFSTTTTSDSMFAGNTYASSSLNTNQNVNITYQIRFSLTWGLQFLAGGVAAALASMVA